MNTLVAKDEEGFERNIAENKLDDQPRKHLYRKSFIDPHRQAWRWTFLGVQWISSRESRLPGILGSKF